MGKNNYQGLDTGRARSLGFILAFVGTVALAMRLAEWWREGHFPKSGFALPLGAIVLALAHILAPANRRAYHLALALFVLVIIVDLLISLLSR
jgi:hypothetical protein